MISEPPGSEFRASGGGSSSPGGGAARSGGLPVPSGRSTNASATLPALSATEARTLSASAVPASQRRLPFSLGVLIGTLRHTLDPSAWYSRTSDLRFRFSSFASQRTVARLPRRSPGSSTSEGGNVSTTTFSFG